MAEPARPAYAVCPGIERSGSTRIPKLFTSESPAKRFLRSEISPDSVEVEAQATGLTVEQARARRAERKAQVRKAQKEAANKVKRGELHPLAYDPRLRPIRNEDRGWDRPVPVRRIADYDGPKCNRRLRDFLPADAIGPMPALKTHEEIRRILEGRSADYTCYLDADWRFAEIEADASRRVAHEYEGRKHRSIGEIVVRAIHDLEAAFQKFHADAPCAAVADFWRSWQVQRHVAEFCSRLAHSDTARSLAGNWLDAAEAVERARMHLYRQLAVFAHELSDEGTCSPAAGKSVRALQSAVDAGVGIASRKMSGTQDTHIPKQSRRAKRQPRRNTKYEGIDKALAEIAEARPKNHEEVFRFLDDHKIAVPNRKLFKRAGGWRKGFQQDQHAASAWLSCAWGRLELPAFARGPKK